MFKKRKFRVLVQYHGLSIGELRKEEKQFVFSYLPGFFESDLAPIPDFPEPASGKKYYSPQLWPFFRNRIPDTRRGDVQQFLKEHNVPQSDELTLLVMLGRETINNPFHLVMAN